MSSRSSMLSTLMPYAHIFSRMAHGKAALEQHEGGLIDWNSEAMVIDRALLEELLYVLGGLVVLWFAWRVLEWGWAEPAEAGPGPEGPGPSGHSVPVPGRRPEG
ncbi:hypothetical protein PR202_gb05461 [Eleusine coracana subsp. coracana]|uniref:Uncharacterized protein n=1 Tax=Eleusine coracana subsp. coracana TaxID=191504 RepID=A0AAV5E4K0_ELECO|nr:hypothetical protein PR202_gb05461 [Eleusine coracana subsp. coracana]